MIAKCTCQHEGQDRLHGRGNRVWNAMGPSGKSGIRCTVCKKEDKSVIAKKDDDKKGKKK